jgi:hypothetical protein
MRLSHAFAGLIDRLLAAQVAFEFGDESIMARHASVKRAKGGPRLAVGKMRYKAVGLPSCLTLRGSTVRLLEEFQKAGGEVFVFGDRPTLVDGKADAGPLAKILDQARTVDLDEDAAEALGGAFDPSVRIDPAQAGASKIVAARRRKGAQRLFFLANTDKTTGYTLDVKLACEGPLCEADLEKGEVVKIGSAACKGGPAQGRGLAGGGRKVRLDFAPAGSHLLLAGAAPTAKGAARPQKIEAASNALDLGGDWQIRLRDPNAQTLDFARLVRPEQKGLVGDKWVLDVADTVKKLKAGTPYRVEYHFAVEVAPEGEVFAVVERLRPDQVLTVNGREITGTESGNWLDPHWLKYPISEHLQRGPNVVAVEGAAGPKVEIEAVYLIGHFGVAPGPGRFRLVAPPKVVKAAGIQNQGLPFFAGEIEITRTFDISKPGAKRLVLEGVDATVVETILNGKSLGRLAWRPFAFDVPKGLLREGRNTLTLVLTNNLRNLLGPHHHRAGELLGVGPGSFRDKANWVDSYCFVGLGVKRVLLS